MTSPARSSLDRVLILWASAGGAGHVRAAQALGKAFQQSGAVRDVRHVDVLQLVRIRPHDSRPRAAGYGVAVKASSSMLPMTLSVPAWVRAPSQV